MLDRPWPFDVIPRVLAASEWARVREGLIQRLRALNLFIDDVYHDQHAVQAGVIPFDLITGSPNFRPECMGVDPPGGIWAHICGSDLVRGEDGTFYVLEDNLRIPSGVSYLLENRMVAKRVFPELFRSYSIEPVDSYVARLSDLLSSVSPVRDEPTMVVLTPGVHNSAYFEHAFLAQQLGIELVEGRDLVVLDDDTVYMRTVGGLERVDVIYRRIDELFLDPEVFRRDSYVGVPGLMRAWRRGNVAVVSSPGAGIADDKAIYAFVPEIIRYFLGEEPILPNVPTWRCGDPEDCQFVLGTPRRPGREARQRVGRLRSGDRPHRRSRGSGPGGPAHRAVPAQLGGPARALALHHADVVRRRRRSPSRGPPTLRRCSAPTGPMSPPGGLTRVARTAGSLIVNSSQGGGSKDTWIVDATLADLDDSVGPPDHDVQAAMPGEEPRGGAWTGPNISLRIDGWELAQ